VSNADMETQFRLKVDSLLMTASWVDRLRHELGLLGASQVWGERPAWYLWLAGFPGAYHIEMVDTAEEGSGPGGLGRALFAIKFYPSPESGMFNHFSPQERALALNGCFDHTGTPIFEKLGEIPPHLFSIGSLEMVCHPAQDWMIFSLAALDLCREVKISQPNPDRPPSEVVVRRAPGWDLAHGLFNSLLSLWSFQHKQTPARIQMTTESGFEMISGMQEPSIRDTPDISLQSMWVMFGADTQIQPLAALGFLDAEMKEQGRQELINHTFSCEHYHHIEDQVKQPGLMSASWWHLASADYKSERCTSCGCDHH
jgi:hypothetical protein